MALRLNCPNHTEHSSVQAYSSCRGKIWKLNVPSKVRTFKWPACSNCLPIQDNLHRKKVRVEMTCEFCCLDPETVTHVLWECPFARNVWSLFKGKTQKCSNQASNFFLLFNHVQAHLKLIFEGAVGLLEEYQQLLSANR